ncbi:hypothetical protein [Pediococcus acidilactici]|uniref:hypothetical protein n=1 Tax=Pediococcus acidilactici TaxID=1254 RepID=UPI00325E56AC
MHKKTMLTALIALGFITPIISNTGASAAGFPKNAPPAVERIQKMKQQQAELPKLTEKQLKVQDSDVETWMPNPTVRETVLAQLIEHGYLPEGSTVNDITKDLLGSVKAGEAFNIFVSGFEGQITPNLSEGLQYFNSQARVFMQIVDADDSQLMKLDFYQLHQNVHQWYFYIVNPEKTANAQLMQKIADAKLPVKSPNVGNLPQIYYIRANYVDSEHPVAPVPTKSIDISKTLFPSVNLTYEDFWKDNNRSLFAKFHMFGCVVTTENFRVVSPLYFYNFAETSENNFLGTLPENETTTPVMQQVNEDPENYYAWFEYVNLYRSDQYQKVNVRSSIYASYHK